MSGDNHEPPDATPDPSTDGSTDEQSGGDGFISKTTEQRLIAQCLKNKEWRKQRWSTRSTLEELEQLEKERPLTHLEKAMKAVGSDIDNQDRRVKRIAIKNLIAMEKQNQEDEHKNDPDGGGQGPVQLTRIVIGDRNELKDYESITMQQLGEIIENEPPIEESEDAD